MKFRTKDNFYIPEIKSDSFSKKDIIDRTGYVPLEATFYQMMSAGVDLTKARDSQFSYEWNQIKDAFESGTSIQDMTVDTTLRKRYNDKLEIDSLYKSKLEKYKNAVSTRDKIEKLRLEFLYKQEIEKQRSEAVNDYIEQEKLKAKANKQQ